MIDTLIKLNTYNKTFLWFTNLQEVQVFTSCSFSGLGRLRLIYLTLGVWDIHFFHGSQC